MGSLGLDRYVVLVEGKGSPDGNYLLELKQCQPSALLPRLATYPQRLADACAEGRPQDGYFNYYAADYRPSAVVAALAMVWDSPRCRRLGGHLGSEGLGSADARR